MQRKSSGLSAPSGDLKATELIEEVSRGRRERRCVFEPTGVEARRESQRHAPPGRPVAKVIRQNFVDFEWFHFFNIYTTNDQSGHKNVQNDRLD
jgi:hypothetical protein